MNKLVLLVALAVMAGSVAAWDGVDTNSGGAVEIQAGNLVRSGSDIEFYDQAAEEYRTGTVESVSRYGRTVEVEIQDDSTGETRTFEMDD